MYRPTVRYDDIFRDYVDKLFHTCHLDRNQIIRGALFAAAHSKEFQELLKPFCKKDVSLPFPSWQLEDGQYWMEQRPVKKERRRDVNDDSAGKTKNSIVDGTVRYGSGDLQENRRLGTQQGPTREIPGRIKTENGRIKIRIG
ncbi:hypothetical protein [Cytobacillus oceanisediminis]|uniref:hypothetical protein n=1 Tax=Cytobacillus oceanisediminis TaxID=665099 RepID=UPI001C212D14|nr:hypothetical protein [Cytobacillus oceanisediminis]MBU8773168.1 hypothetical protein [Cytobacillus oceanisediminis]